MKLITYMDKGELRTLMVNEFRDAYMHEGRRVVKYAISERRIEIPYDDVLAEHALREPLHDVIFTD